MHHPLLQVQASARLPPLVAAASEAGTAAVALELSTEEGGILI